VYGLGGEIDPGSLLLKRHSGTLAQAGGAYLGNSGSPLGCAD
jgi:hypothetical protein